MTFTLSTALGKFRLLALLEGVSFLVILFVTMPLKYGLDYGQPNKIFGMAHGVLFIMYVAGVVYMKFDQKWGLRVTFLAMLASIVPFGTFWADKVLFKESQRAQNSPV